MKSIKSPTVLVILDGWGVGKPDKGNAIALSKKPAFNRLWETYPHTTLGATGGDVGLEDNKMSGSETGHMNIGAGRVVPQDSFYITESIKNGSFFMNPAFNGALQHVKRYGGNLHIMGLMGNSDSPHSEPEHFRAILKLAKKGGAKDVYCHLFTDGRDSYPKSAPEHLRNFKKIMAGEGIGKIATLSGRFYAMDRAKNWDRLMKAYEAIAFSKGERADSAEEAIKNNYKKKLSDEFLLPTVIFEEGKPVARLQKNDAIIFYNFRSDRARQFTKFFVHCAKDCTTRDNMPVAEKMKNLHFVAMTDFGPDLDVRTAFPQHAVDATLPMALSGIKQLYTAETEKYAHVTYFLNGGYADPVGGEDRVIVSSPIVDSYDKVPEMSAGAITHGVLGYVKNNVYDFIAINFANADMVGHTGNLKATIKAVNAVDVQLGLLAKEVLAKNGNMLITADHGNADIMLDPESGQPYTFHTKNPVPFILAGERFRRKKLEEGGVLGNIAPTILDILEMSKPKAMKKKSLLK